MLSLHNHSLQFSEIAGKPKPLKKVGPSMDTASPVAKFPHLSSSHRALMADLVVAVEKSLGSNLLPSAVPHHVLFFQSPSGNAEGSLDIRSGAPGSSVDFILESWLHCKLPTGGTFDTTTLSAFLNAATNAPHLLIEFIQSCSTSMILIIDLLPRTDLVLHPEYLDEFYQATELEKHRQELENAPQVLPYRSSSLFIRSLLSPTAIAVSIDCNKEGEAAMEEILAMRISSVAKEIVKIWLDTCACSSKQLGEVERAELVKRDNIMKNKTIEIDLAANLPRLFGPDIAGRVVGEIQKAFKM